MFRRLVSARSRLRLTSPHNRPVFTPAAAAPPTKVYAIPLILIGGFTCLFWYSTTDGRLQKASSLVNCDASSPTLQHNKPLPKDIPEFAQTYPGLYLWGTNIFGVVDPELASNDIAATHVSQGPNSLSTNTVLVKYPRRLRVFDGLRLRHVTLSETSAAVIDDKGDLYQWGAGFTDPNAINTAPVKSVVGHDLVRLSMSSTFLYALSRHGTIYMIPISSDAQARITGTHPIHQQAKLAPPPAPSSWFSPMTWIYGSAPAVNQFPSFRSSSSDPFVDIAAGMDQFTVLTKSGRVLSAPTSTCAFQNGCLGRDPSVSETHKFNIPPEFPPKNLLGTPQSLLAQPASCARIEKLDDIELHPINIPHANAITQISSGDHHTIALTKTGLCYTWGSNSHGQLGLGSWTLANQVIPVPTEIRTGSAIPSTVVNQVAASGNVTALITSSVTTKNQPEQFEVWTCGNGQFGNLGTGLYTHVQPSLVRVRYLSGKLEYSESRACNMPIKPHSLVLSPAHAACLLGESPSSVLVWGSGSEYATGVGSRKLLPVPTSPLALPWKYGFRPATAGASESSNNVQAAPGDNVYTTGPGEQMVLLDGQHIQLGLGVSCIYDQA